MIKRIIFQMVILFTAGALCLAPVSAAAAVQVRLETTHGDILLSLFEDKAPKTVANFVKYVRDGFFDNTVFHRVIKGFMIQGGGLTPEMEKKPTRAPIPNEADNGLKNRRGTVAMARTMDPHSATSQFFINTKDNSFLDYKAPTPRGWGYCVFGRVVEGMETVDRIESVETASKAGRKDVPAEPVVIRHAEIVEKQEAAEPAPE